MDPVSAAIIGALISGALAGITTAAADAPLTALYRSLKARIVAKFGHAPDVAAAVEQLEQRPDSAARQAVVTEEITRSGAAEDPEIVALAQTILKVLEDDAGSPNVQIATGDFVAQANRQSTATVTIENSSVGQDQRTGER